MNRPNFLFQYIGDSTQSIENIQNQVIYFQFPSEFNDAFDCISPAFSRKHDQLSLETFRKFMHDFYIGNPDKQENYSRYSHKNLRFILNKGCSDALSELQVKTYKRGVSCFSERNDNLLMWGHYGGNYKGFCLKFSTAFAPFDLARKVEYSKRRPKVDWNFLFGTKRDEQELVRMFFCKKPSDWKYEKEWRIIGPNGGYVYPYQPKVLESVYFGPRTILRHKEMVYSALKSVNPKVNFFEGNLDKSQFRVVFTPVFLP